ncbi:uncharacterized protein TRUGW13939_01097 [Talaromyces rugulosus]|uniref:Uncharacterized protein n=1 Tax=Talaromyces rugulosus TaxID=121627 RepID=A0A7H8QKH4_TALRU|nr:uncharacterized protein TRUGW13939_01097 [Talaromyces rugulosus]QKX54015.1 hypothetical protein TRUGW13939_01097 [Talaromyces rugulosus]
MAAVSERIQGLRRPGASLLKKTLPARPNDKALSRKAVNPAAADISINISENNTPTAFQENTEPHKDLPLPPLPHVVPQVARPPRGSSMNDNRNQYYNQNERPQERQPVSNNNNLLAPQPSRNARPVSEAPSISQFIPDPEPEPFDLPISPDLIIDGQKTPDSSSNNSTIHNTVEWTPPLPDPVVIAPLTRVHYDCFQAHRHMLQSNNVWYATACMTCHKLDQEVRHRCTFCCLRVCVACFERLQKSKDRSLAECFP